MQALRIADGVYRLRTLMVNVYFVAESNRWVLVDTGMRGCAGAVRREARRLFPAPPAAILITHGHFDHVGGLPQLAVRWDVPVYAHRLELPYLTGVSPYPPPDPTVGGGTQSWISPLFPRGPIDLDGRIRVLPADGVAPGLDEWQWVPTPGHSPGHVSFYRPRDGVIVAGDAVVTTKQESTWSILTGREQVWRPPAYYTCDWNAAGQSVSRLAALEPNVLATGHGHAMFGAPMRRALHALADNFDRVMPAAGRYIPYPAVADERGVVHVPPRVPLATSSRAAVGAAALAAGVAMMAAARRRV
jgi:glyoxylase-like metal-dependent hydrolase (beta-lactamase superfamily II)